MDQVILYIHGQGGTPREAERFRPLCPGYDVIGVGYQGSLPWQVRGQLLDAYCEARRQYRQVSVLANSIGCYFAMDAFRACAPARAYFISPVLDMEQLILDRMRWAGVSEAELQAKGEIPTEWGDPLSWRYLCYVRERPLQWDVSTEILYGDQDGLTGRQTVDAFVRSHPARLTVMAGGEHWFHTAEQLAFLDGWLRNVLD